MSWSAILTGRSTEVSIPLGRQHVCEDDGESPYAVGRRYGKLTILGKADSVRGGRYWCRCDCGTDKEVFGFHLSSGNTTSCGCSRGRQSGRKAVYGFPCECGCGQITQKHQTIKRMTRSCYRRARRVQLRYREGVLIKMNEWRGGKDTLARLHKAVSVGGDVITVQRKDLAQLLDRFSAAKKGARGKDAKQSQQG